MSASQQLLLTIPEAAKRLCIGRTRLYDLIRRGEIPVVRNGRSVRINPTSLKRWIREREKESARHEPAQNKVV